MHSPDHYRDHYHSINANPAKPHWHHPSNARKQSDALWAPDNPSSGLLCPNPLIQEPDASLHHAMSQPCSALGHEKTISILDGHSTMYPYDAHKGRNQPQLNEKLIADFVQAMSDLVSRYRKTINPDSQQHHQEVRDLANCFTEQVAAQAKAISSQSPLLIEK